MQWSTFVDDGKIKAFNVEKAPSGFKASGAEVFGVFPGLVIYSREDYARYLEQKSATLKVWSRSQQVSTRKVDGSFHVVTADDYCTIIRRPASTMHSYKTCSAATPFRRTRIWSSRRQRWFAEMAKKAIQYAVVDAFAAEPFKGNPAALCLLEEEDAAAADEQWMQSVAAEFNLPQTAFLVRDDSSAGDASTPRFHLRWFTPVAEVNLCGHATLASAHFLFTTVLAKHDMVEFATKSGILTAKKVPAPENTGVSGEEGPGKLFIELDFPMIDLVECNSAELPSIPETLNGANIVSVHKSATTGDLIVELSSGKEVADIIPNSDEIIKCAGRGVIVTAPAPAGSGYDFFTRFFCPKFGVYEDHVCGSAHCVLAPYFGGKLGKQKLTAFQASPRTGTLYLELEDVARRVRIQGEAVTVMTGTLLA